MVKGDRRSRPSKRQPDWVAIEANLRWLHTFVDSQYNQTANEVHEAVHLLARDLGFPEDWLHRDERA